jgi:hypothetical protein
MAVLRRAPASSSLWCLACRGGAARGFLLPLAGAPVRRGLDRRSARAPGEDSRDGARKGASRRAPGRDGGLSGFGDDRDGDF